LFVSFIRKKINHLQLMLNKLITINRANNKENQFSRKGWNYPSCFATINMPLLNKRVHRTHDRHSNMYIQSVNINKMRMLSNYANFPSN